MSDLWRLWPLILILVLIGFAIYGLDIQTPFHNDHDEREDEL